MPRILVAWIGSHDLRASKGELPDGGEGPIAKAVGALPFDRIILLANYPPSEVDPYVTWLRARRAPPIDLHRIKLRSPTNFRDIHEGVVGVLSNLKDGTDGTTLTFHLSPGTSQMAAVWVLLSKTRFPANLIQSSPEAGVEEVDLPFDISAEFLPLLKRADERIEKLASGFPTVGPGFDGIVGRSPEVQKAIALARRIAMREVTVLIEGESGTGKEVFAKAIHEASLRSAGPRVIVNSAALDPALMGSELFGHEKGAFTGAVNRHDGFFRQADGGTLFLDEIADLSRDSQARLLRVLQEKLVRPIGSTKEHRVNVRIIAATNKSLAREVREGRFREDLYHRIAVVRLTLPPLRERRGDLSSLIEYFLGTINEDARKVPGIPPKRLAPRARNLLLAYPWPGNVRELHNKLLGASVIATGDVITEEDVRGAFAMDERGSEPVATLPLGDGFDLRKLTNELARAYIQRALTEVDGNKSKAAMLLGLPSHQTLTNWMKRCGATGIMASPLHKRRRTRMRARTIKPTDVPRGGS